MYAGGIVVLYLFVVMLVNLKRPPEVHAGSAAPDAAGVVLSGMVLSELAGIVGYGVARGEPAAAAIGDAPAGLHGEHRAGRVAAVHRLSDPVRSRVDAAARRDGRRDHSGEERALGRGKTMIEITQAHYAILSASLFMIGVIGVLVRRNIIIIFMSIELILNAVNINLVAFSRELQHVTGQVFAVFVIAVAAAEAAVGLGIILAFYRNKETVNIDEMNS